MLNVPQRIRHGGPKVVENEPYIDAGDKHIENFAVVVRENETQDVLHRASQHPTTCIIAYIHTSCTIALNKLILCISPLHFFPPLLVFFISPALPPFSPFLPPSLLPLPPSLPSPPPSLLSSFPPLMHSLPSSPSFPPLTPSLPPPPSLPSLPPSPLTLLPSLPSPPPSLPSLPPSLPPTLPVLHCKSNKKEEIVPKWIVYQPR